MDAQPQSPVRMTAAQHFYRWKLSNPNLPGRLASALIILVTLLPIANIIHILASTGADNLSNDYALFLPIIDQIASGSYNWAHFLSDSFNVSHFQPLPILLHLANARLSGWNIYYELYFIVILTAVRVLLTCQALTHMNQRPGRGLMLPVVSLLVFSASQVSSFEFGPSAVREGLTAFGITLGIWGLVKFDKPAIGLANASLGGLVASWAGAPGIMIWPVFALGMFTLGYRKVHQYAAWLAAAVLVNFPYLYFLLLNPKPGVNASLHSLLDLRLVVNIIGRPFANGIGSTTSFLPLGEAAGWLGLLLGTVGVGMVIVLYKHLLKPSAPAIMFMAYGLLTAWQTSVYRVLIAPWYTTMVMSYWIGLAGLAYLLAAGGRPDEWIGKKWKATVLAAYPVMILVVMAGLYLATNLAYRDKSFYLVSRSPASAACLRHYTWAPTYCERSVFQWTVNRVFLADFARPLQSHAWSVFNQHQRWTMQGEVILGNVYSPQTTHTPGVEWFDALPGESASFSDYRHLNARVMPGYPVYWKVRLPGQLSSAVFSSAVGVGMLGGAAPSQSPVTFEVYLSVENGAEVLVFQRELLPRRGGWSEFKIDLAEYGGRELVVSLAVRGGDEQAAALYRFPTIDLSLPAESSESAATEVRPINTDLADGSPQPGAQDFLFFLGDARLNGLSAVGTAANTWQVQANPYIYIQLEEPLSLENYGWIAFRQAVSPDIPSRGAEVRLFFEGRNEPVNIMVPLMKDGASYLYTYPLWLVDIPGRLTALRLDPVQLPASRGENTIKVDEIRLISTDIR